MDEVEISELRLLLLFRELRLNEKVLWDEWVGEEGA